jgi:hypothetical protein
MDFSGHRQEDCAMQLSERRRKLDWGVVVCALLLTAFAILSALSVTHKSATYDEPVHLVQGWEELYHGDYRIEIGHPPLCGYWAALPLGPGGIIASFQSPKWTHIADEPANASHFSVDTLYANVGNDADAILFRCRMMMLLPGIVLGALLALWSWQLAGRLAAVAATALFCLDPNFLAHTPLVKNDVSCALVFLAAAHAIWLAGRRLTFPRIILLALVPAIGLCVKLSCFLLGPVVAAALVGRALLGPDWAVGQLKLHGKLAKLSMAVLLCLFCAAVAVVVIWACYRFRFAASTDPSFNANLTGYAELARVGAARARHPGSQPTTEELATQPAPRGVALILFAAKHKLLPESWLKTLLSMYFVTTDRDAFLLDQTNKTGWWYYFPLVFFFKTPMATLTALALTSVSLAWLTFRNRPVAFEHWWVGACIGIPAIVYLGAAMAGSVNLGVRHLLPIYPFVFLIAGTTFSRLYPRDRRIIRLMGVILGIGLAVETLAAYPNYIPFFNAACGGARGGLHLLSDSNIDWGQDLPLLADWQQQHSNQQLYLCYFGTVPPSYYGIRYVNLPGSFAPDTPGSDRAAHGELSRGVIAISATHLQGTYLRGIYRPLLDQKPIAVLGGSIYLFELR